MHHAAKPRLTAFGASEGAAVRAGEQTHCSLGVHSTIGHNHGQIVLVHDLASHMAHQLAVHMLGPGQAFRQPLESLHAALCSHTLQ